MIFESLAVLKSHSCIIISQIYYRGIRDHKVNIVTLFWQWFKKTGTGRPSPYKEQKVLASNEQCVRINTIDTYE